MPASRDRDLLVRGARAWRGDGWSPPSDLVVREGRIESIVPAGEGAAPEGAPVLEAAGCHALPGFVNTHTHLFQALLRGAAEGLGLHDWLFAIGEAYVAATPEQSAAAAAAAAAELLRSGATTIVEHGYPHPDREVHDAIVEAVSEVGARVIYCRGIADKADPGRQWGFEPRLIEPWDDQLTHVEQLHRRFAEPGCRLSVGLAPPNPRALSPGAMGDARELSDRLGLPVSVHLCETDFDDRSCLEHAGLRAAPYLDRHGFLWDRFLGVHCVHVGPEDRALLAERGCAVSYNPVCNMRLGSGFAPIPEFLELGVPVGIGVDGAASNDTQDMFEALRYGSYVQRGRLGDATALGAPAMIRMATDGANRALGVESRPAGLQPGLAADLVLVRFERELSAVPALNPAVTLLTQATSRSVESVIVAGEVVVSDGRCVRVSEDDVIARAVRAANSLPEEVVKVGWRRGA
ncbi:MAG TPA: amidohydrolase family protein [Actinomycetota bacterium]